MYSVTVRDHILIAHSLKNALFGPAQNMHGATYVVDVEFFAENLNNESIVIDMGDAQEKLKEVLAELNYQNLDEHPYFKELLSTTEVIAKFIHDRIKDALSESFDGTIKVTLGESPSAWASYQGS
jgi:6-pyruvoyltetrahydropterin/6-carboxytetrahydropterin synthase